MGQNRGSSREWFLITCSHYEMKFTWQIKIKMLVLDASWIISVNENQWSFTVFWWVRLLNPLYNSQHYEHFPSWNNPLGRSVPFPLPFTFAVAKSRMWTPNFLSPEEGKVKPTFLFSGVCSFVSMVYYFLIKNTLKFLVTSSYDSSALWLTIQVILFFWEYV